MDKELQNKMLLIIEKVGEKVYGGVLLETADIPSHLRLTICHNFSFHILLPVYKIMMCSIEAIVNHIIDEYKNDILRDYLK